MTAISMNAKRIAATLLLSLSLHAAGTSAPVTLSRSADAIEWELPHRHVDVEAPPRLSVDIMLRPLDES